jgi:anti-anti-sigma factor
MRIHRKRKNGIVVLELSGELWGGSESLAILDELDRLGREGQLETVLDLSRVTHVASTGFGILMRARRDYARHGGHFVLCGANPRVMSLLEVTRLDLVFDVRETCREALEAAAELP